MAKVCLIKIKFVQEKVLPRVFPFLYFPQYSPFHLFVEAIKSKQELNYAAGKKKK